MESDGVIPILHVRGRTRLPALVNQSPEMEAFRIDVVTGIESAFQSLKELEFSAVLLDLALFQGCGFEALLQLRRCFAMPILVLSNRDGEHDRVLAYEMGADDFLGEGIGGRELAARLRVGIGRSASSPPSRELENSILIAQDLQMDIGARKVRRSGELISLTHWEFELLATLVRRRGRICSRETLLNSVAGECFTVLERTVDVHIASLRKKLGDSSEQSRYIRTVRGVGYCFCQG